METTLTIEQKIKSIKFNRSEISNDINNIINYTIEYYEHILSLDDYTDDEGELDQDGWEQYKVEDYTNEYMSIDVLRYYTERWKTDYYNLIVVLDLEDLEDLLLLIFEDILIDNKYILLKDVKEMLNNFDYSKYIQ